MKIFGKTFRPSEVRALDDCDRQLSLMRGLTYHDALGVLRSGDSWGDVPDVDVVDAGNAAWRARLLADVEAASVGADAGVTYAGMLAAGFALTVCLVTSVWLLNYAATVGVSP